MFLYEKLDALREYENISELPSYIAKNLNSAFELRPYQVQAFENFVTHFESKNTPRPLQVLFHMATSSGKTLIMAGLMLLQEFSFLRQPDKYFGQDAGKFFKCGICEISFCQRNKYLF